jgi:hypothetical protein
MGVLLSSGCLGPQASDDLPVTATSYPTAESVPRLESVPALEQKLLKSQGFKGTIIPLRTGFFGGEQVSYWDFGQGTTLVAPVYMLVTDVADDGSDFTPLPNHPVLFGVIPGQFGYTPLWQLVLVPITSAYNQEQITSIGAIQAAREQGLLGASITLSIAVDCPIVHRDSRLEERNGERAPTEAYWEGYRVSYFNLGTTDIEANGASGSEEAYYTLRREGGEPLDEAVRGVDMNGDGDLFDSNHVFNSLPGEPTYTPMVVATEVVVTRDTASVDTPDVEPDVKGHADLFDPDDGLPLTHRVIAVYPGTELRYLPRAEREAEGSDAATDVTRAEDTTDVTAAEDTTEASSGDGEPGPIPDAPITDDIEPGPTLDAPITDDIEPGPTSQDAATDDGDLGSPSGDAAGSDGAEPVPTTDATDAGDVPTGPDGDSP